MRSFKLTLILCGLMLLVTPTKAHAWWELLDYLSGPGPFFGPRVDVRQCLGGTTIDFQAIDDGLGNLVEAFRLDRTPGPVEARSLPLLSAAITTLKDLQNRLNEIDKVFPVNDGKLGTLRSLIEILDKQSDAQKSQPIAAADLALLVSSIHKIDLALDRVKKASVFVGASSVLISLCRPGTVRKWAVEGGVSSMWSVPVEKWANNHTIWLNELTAGLSYHFFRSSVTHDFLDVGGMYGGYFLSSAGITGTVSTQFVEPYFDLHAPTSFMDRTGPKYWLSLLTWRVAFPVFLRQIEKSELNGPDDIEKHEATRFTVTVHYNVWPQLRKRTHKL